MARDTVMARKVKRVLVIRFSSIGDVILTTPVIRCLKKQLPGTELHYLTKEHYASILEHNPYIDRVHTIHERIGEVIPELRKTGFDAIIDLHNNIRSNGVLFSLGRRKHTFPKLNFKKWLLVNFKINRLPAVHIVDRYFRAVNFLGVHNDHNGLDYFIAEEDYISATHFPETFGNGFICFGIGGRHFTKILPEEKIIGICDNLPKPVVLLGGPEDWERGERIRKASAGEVYNSCGEFSINQSASVVGQALTVITHDTGIMHIAAALKKNIISVWGNTVPEFGMYPYYPASFRGTSEIVEVKGLSCRPCSKIGFTKCPRKHFDCMNKIDVEQIIRLAGDQKT